MLGVAILINSRDPRVREASLSIGSAVENATGSRAAGALAAVGTKVVGTVGLTAYQMVPSGLRDAVEFAAAHNTPGSLIPAGFATPRYAKPLSYSHCFHGQCQ
jgi:hypothetical protein